MYLNCHTYYSLKYGTLPPKKLVEKAQQLNIRSLALTDINNTSCTFEFIQLCQQAGIKPVVGMEFKQEDHCHFIGIAKNNEGFKCLNQLFSNASIDGHSLPAIPPYMKDVYIIYPKLPKPIEQFNDNEYLGIMPNHVNKLFGHKILNHKHKLVALQPVTFEHPEDHKTHQLLRAIDLNIVLSRLDNKHIARPTEALVTPDQMQSWYQMHPELLDNAIRILDDCHIEMTSGLKNNKQSFTENAEDDYELLEKLALNGCKKRYGSNKSSAPKAMQRIKKELRVIKDLGFCSYFLITWDIIRYAMTSGYHHVGRGSGANSIVAYCLEITDVDPLELDLYFERFINPHRTSPPDFDIDFSWDERDDITDYIFKRYGRHHTALLATYSTFKGKSIIRELGKVFGLPKSEIDKMIDAPDNKEQHHELAQTIYHYGRKLEGFPNYLSIHAGGIVISEQPIYHFTALQLMPKGFPITHFDMYHAEALGLHKFDVLSQRGLGHIKDTVELIRENQGQSIDIHQVPRIKEDLKVKELLKAGKCIGCFYVESPAMRGLLTKLGCENYVHLVAASSIIRPGVARSGMMREYIKRFHRPNDFKYLHPSFREHLGETFGIMVYQEDVMKIVHHFAGLDLDESDVLRRIMSGKKYRTDTFARLKKKYFNNCREKGHPDELTNEVWRQVESFSGYSFCKAHSASFAVESMQSLFLKAYFPLEFMVAVINNFGGFYKTEFYFHEARMLGGHIHPPCINHSDYLTSIQQSNIYIGWIHLHQLGHQTAQRIVDERRRNGLFSSFESFMQRVSISGDQIDLLIRIGAFRFTGKTKASLMWAKNGLLKEKKTVVQSGPTLFQSPELTNYALPDFEDTALDQAFDEIELLGFPLCPPFQLIQLETATVPYITSKSFKESRHQVVTILGYFVCRKNVRTIKGQLMNFGTWLDQDGHYFDTTHFPQILEKFPLRGPGVYKIKGKVVEDFGFYTLDVVQMEKIPFIKDLRYE